MDGEINLLADNAESLRRQLVDLIGEAKQSAEALPQGCATMDANAILSTPSPEQWRT